MQQHRFDVIVVGGGPAGITAATALGRSGFSVLVCEAAVFPGAENWSGAVYFTENLEVPEAFGAEAIENGPWERRLIERGFFLHDGHSLLGGTLRDPGVFRSCYTVLRPVFDRYLAEVSREHHVVVLAETTVQSLIRQRDRVIGVHTERGPAYADVVFLAEGDASHLVTQEGYERGDSRFPGAGDASGDGGMHEAGPGGPHFLQGVKEVVSLPPEVIEERFGLPEGAGGAYELLLRNGNRKGRTVRLNMGGFLYTNRDSVSLGFVLPIDNLARGFDGDHNLLMEWFKALPDVARWIEGGEVTSYGAKIIRGGGIRELPRLVDDGLAIGGAASGIGLDFPYPNFTGPATAMGLMFARAVREIAADNGGPRGGGQHGEKLREGGWREGAPSGSGPYTKAALERAYLEPLKRSHYYRNVERLADWPSYIERTQIFFERQIDVVNGTAHLLSRPDVSAPRRWWRALRLQRKTFPVARLGAAISDARAMAGGLQLGRAVREALGLRTIGRWLVNTITALLPHRSARVTSESDTTSAFAYSSDGGQMRLSFRVMAGAEPAGRVPWLARWYWKRFGPALAGAFADVYTNDDEPLDTKLPRALGRLIDRLSVWDLLVGVGLGVAGAVGCATQASLEWLRKALFGRQAAGEADPVTRMRADARRRLRMDDEAVEITTPYATKLGTISYHEGQHSHIKVLWPRELTERAGLTRSPLWSVCPAKVYEVRRHSRGMPGVVVNFDNCVKCETCWRATPDVHWSRATRQRLIYETYTATHPQLRDYLMSRPEPSPRLRRGPGYWDDYWGGIEAKVLDRLRAELSGDAAAIDAVAAELEACVAASRAFESELGESPMALEPGWRARLDTAWASAHGHFAAARSAWGRADLEGVRTALGDLAATVWVDAAGRFEEAGRHAAAGRYFWAGVLSEQLRDHHVRGLDALLSRLVDLGWDASTGGRSPERRRRVWAQSWPAVEAQRGTLAPLRRLIRARCEEHLHSRAIRALEHSEPLSAAQRDWLHEALAEAAAVGRARVPFGSVAAAVAGPAGPGERAPLPPYGPRDVLLEELAGRDVSLAALAAQHLLACDLLRSAGAGVGERRGESDHAVGSMAGDEHQRAELATVVADLVVGRRLAAVVHQGSIQNQPVESGRKGHEDGSAPEAISADEVELHGEVPYALAGVADWLLVVAVDKGYLVPADDPGVRIEDVGSIGLLAAGPRRVRFVGCRVPAGRIVDLGAKADVLETGVLDLLAIVRGAGDYLLDRARDHAGSRLQFPGAFQDEAGRDSIAKFGAVKQMLAEMESQRFLIESLSVVDPCSGQDPWVGAAVRKVAAADALGPRNGSFTYNTGQVFGGTAFSEDDVLAKFYRDSSPFRFLLAHDDALRIGIGVHRAAALARGDNLVPLSNDEREWLDRAAAGALGDSVASWEAACEAVEAWVRNTVVSVVSADRSEDGGNGDRAAAADAQDAQYHLLGDAFIRACGVKVCLLRTVWRQEAGLPAGASIEATRLLAERWGARAPAIVGEGELVEETLAVGDATIALRDFEPCPEAPGIDDYEALLGTDQAAESGDWLSHAFDRSRARYLPEILWNDAVLSGLRTSLEAELRERFVNRTFNGLTYNRYLEKLHHIPAEDLDYIVRRGLMRMPIPRRLGGEEATKAAYYLVCELTGRYGDGSLSLAIMGNTSIGTTPTLLGMDQDLPRARAELQRVQETPELLAEIETKLDELIGGLGRLDPEALETGYRELASLVKKRIVRSSVLKYIGGGFLRAFFAAGGAGERRDLDGFGEHLEEARGMLDDILVGAEERLEEYPRRERAHELFLQMISAGYISAFALTEPTAGSDSGGVKTTAKLRRRRVHEDEDGVLHFFLDEEDRAERRNLLDSDRLEFDFSGHRILYRYSPDAEPAEVRHDRYDYEMDRPGHWRTYLHGDREIEFTDIAQIRGAGDERFYEYWELSGAKMWITNGRFMHCMALYAQTEPEGVTGFMVDRHAEGLVVGADEEKLGQRGSPTNELSLNAVRVPRECVIGFRGRGQVNALETLNAGRAGLAVTARATIQEMVDDATGWLGEQPRFTAFAPVGVDGPVAAARDAVGVDLAADSGARSEAVEIQPIERYFMGRITEELTATASVAHELIGLLDHPNTRSVRMESAIGKYYATEAEHDCIEWMERLRGLDGLTHDHRIEKTRRDARVLNIYEGTNEVQRFLLLRDLVQRVLPAHQQRAGEVEAERRRAIDEATHPDLVGQLEDVKARLIDSLDQAMHRFGQHVWSNVNLQPVFFRLAEIAGLIKVLDATLYRLEWVKEHRLPAAYVERLERASRLAFRRGLVRISELERRYSAAYAYLDDGRYPPDVQLGFLSLAPEGGTVAERWGELPEMLRARAPVSRQGEPLRIAVPLKPVPLTGGRPRLIDGDFAESLYTIGGADRQALRGALSLKEEDRENITLAVYALGGAPGIEILRQALAAGADEAHLIEWKDDEGGIVHDQTAFAELLLAALEEAPADLVLCGATTRDTSQNGLASYLAARLGRDHVEGIGSVDWATAAPFDGTVRAPTLLRVTAEAWRGAHLDYHLPLVCSLEAGAESPELVFDLEQFLQAAAAPIPRFRCRRENLDRDPVEVAHLERRGGRDAGPRSVARSPDEAAGVLIEVAGQAAAGAEARGEPYTAELLGLGRQPADDLPSCVFVGMPVGAGSADPPEGLDDAARLCRALGLALDVVLPVDTRVAVPDVVGQVATARPRRIYVVEIDAIEQLGWKGHLEWLIELWSMYRGRAEWLVGSELAGELFSRFAGTRPPEAERCYSWYNVAAVGNGGGRIRVASDILDGAARAVATLPRRGGLRVVTLAKSVELAMGDRVVEGGSRIRDPAEATDDAPEVYRYSPEIDDRFRKDPLARLLSELGDGELTLGNAEFVIDFGYGAGGREGLEQLAEPLLDLLVNELGLERTMIGATRKVTQDLEILPMDRQIGQTGVRVDPTLLVALAVSGAPQHIDWVGDRAVILAFNIDPDAPLMRLNEQRPTPLVHPIVGDVWETVPRFIEAIRELRSSSDSAIQVE